MILTCLKIEYIFQKEIPEREPKIFGGNMLER
jgi:hypothetical protein